MLFGLLRMRGRVAFGDVGLTESEREMLRPPLFLAPMTLAAVGIVVSGWGR
jgi:hypothetical protein